MRRGGERGAAERSASRSASALPFFQEMLAARAHSIHLLWEKPFYMSRGPELLAEQQLAPEEEEAPSLSPVAAAAPVPAVPEPVPEREEELGRAEADAGVEAAVRAAVLAALAETEPPLSESVAAAISERAVRKICQRHAGATDASFLGAEGRRVRELVAAYVLREASRGSRRPAEA